MNAPVPVQVIAIASGKGGVGKTQAAVNLAWSLAARGRRVMVLDANFALPSVDLALGVQPEVTLADVMEGRCRLGDALYGTPGGFQIIAGAAGRLPGQFPPLQQAGLIQAFSDLPVIPEVLLIDCAPGIGSDVLGMLRAASEVLLVVNDEPAASAAAYSLLRRLAQEHGLSRFRLMASMTLLASEGRALHERLLRQSEALGGVSLDYLGAVPADDSLRRAVQRQRTVCEVFPHSRAANAYRELAEKIDAWPLPANPRGHLEFFVERLIGAQAAPRPARP